MDKFRENPPNTWPQCIDVGIGHEGTKIHKKMAKTGSYYRSFSFTVKIAGYSLTLQALFMRRKVQRIATEG